MLNERYRAEASFYVNGALKGFRGDPEMTLLEYLRANCLTGTKLACGEGGCGACTVQVTRRLGKVLRHISVNACLALVCDMDGAHVKGTSIAKAQGGCCKRPHRLASPAVTARKQEWRE
eukprot:GEMP01043105.1.p1 GENE.GEMP01043105.1~~GEMP01043105.1.p1  ORF type:complete len:119 (+),score=28.65 GEMP01043105.1:171-527(+)